MDIDDRLDGFDDWDAGAGFDGREGDGQEPWADAPTAQDTAASFHEQFMRGDWPIRVPMSLEIYAEGAQTRVHLMKAGRARRSSRSHIVTLVLEYDRAHVRAMLLEWIREPRAPGKSLLIDLVDLIRVDRKCFLDTATDYFARALSTSDASLRSDRLLFAFVRDLHELDGEAIGELVAETVRRNRAAGERLRGVLLDLVAHPVAREHLGWLVAAAIAEQLEEL